MRQYKNTGVLLASSCATAKALADKDTKLAEKTFKETTQRFEQQFPIAAHREWFLQMSRGIPSYQDHEAMMTPEDLYAADVHVYELEALLFSMRCKVGMQPTRPYMIVSSQLFSVRRRLENVRRNFAQILDQLTYQDRQAVQDCPSWRVGTVIY